MLSISPIQPFIAIIYCLNISLTICSASSRVVGLLQGLTTAVLPLSLPISFGLLGKIISSKYFAISLSRNPSLLKI